MRSGGKLWTKISNLNVRQIMIIILICLILIIIVLILNISSTEKIKIINIYHEPENPNPGDNITIFAEITGGSSLLGAYVECVYDYFFNAGIPGMGQMGSIDNNLYSFTHQVSYNESFKVWYLIFVDRKIGKSYSIQIGNEKSNLSTITISNVTHYPQFPNTDTYYVQVSADIESNFYIEETGVKYKIICPIIPYGASGESTESNGEPYFFSIPLYMDYSYTSSGKDEHYPKGSKVFYAVTAKDKLGNIAVSPIYDFKIR
jgi:hypothetical protein